MAENAAPGDEEILRNAGALLWGQSAKEDVFKRWAQGFIYSPDEQTALIQVEGGPCAVIAPVQAFILKQLLSETELSTWKSIKESKTDQLLVKATAEILNQASGDRNPRFRIVYVTEKIQPEDSRNQDNTEKSEGGRNNVWTSEDAEKFHSQLRIFPSNNLEEIQEFLTEKLDIFKDQFGVLLLLYSVICTRGTNEIKMEMSDPMESMIDSTYGYGSQSLINLMLTGRAVSHVWDHDQNIGGLNLRGIEKQNPVGFLALLEHLRYCEVGSFLKSPSHPIWVLGSETHLTVLFSTEKSLVSPETPAQKAKRVFRKFDPEGNNFIPSNLLQTLLEELGLVAEAEYVDIMRRKLDSENLGIILWLSFVEEFFPEEVSSCPDVFPLYHYNGLQRNNPENKVKYHKGQAVLLECTVKGILDSNPMLTVLQTKWPRIEIQWDIGRSPSLN